MRLLDGGKVPNARRVRIFLAEKGITVPLEPDDLGRNEHKSEKFTALNALQRVPVLELDDGTILTESIAICRYFEEMRPNPPLFGQGPQGKAVVEMWQRRMELDLLFPIAHAFRHLHPAMAGYETPQVADWGAANRERAVAFMGFLDRELEKRPMICGDSFTIADITGLVALDFTKAARIEIPADLPHLRRWHASLSARPSAKA